MQNFMKEVNQLELMIIKKFLILLKLMLLLIRLKLKKN